MATRLTADTDIDALAERLGVGPDEELRSSTRREQHLETYGRIMAGEPDLTLDLHPEAADIVLKDGENRIRIPTRAFDQPETDLPQNAYDLLSQETLTLHEVGHYLYSDWPSFEDRQDDLEEYLKDYLPETKQDHATVYQSAFKMVWNAIEDGCIERFLGIEFRCENEFYIINENLSSANSFGKTHMRGGEDRTVYTMLQAVLLALMDIGHHESGDLKKLLDTGNANHTITTSDDDRRFRDFLPRIEKVIEDAQSEPDAVTRNDIVCTFFMDLVDLLDEADTSGLRDVNKQGEASPMDGKPDDAHEGIGEAQADMDMDDMDAHGGSSGSSDPTAVEPAKAVGGGDNDDVQDDDGGESGLGDLEDDVADQYEDALRDEAKEIDGGESLIEELETFQDVLKRGGKGQTNMELIIPDRSEPNHERWSQARAEGKRLKTILEDRLQESRHDQWRRGVQSGKFDRGRMIQAARSDPRACKRPRQGDQKDYSCILVVDRSGSMKNDIEDVEIATGAFAYALEQLGVDVMVLDFVGGRTRLAKPFGQSIQSAKDTVFTGKSGGGTPLTDASHLSRLRVGDGAGSAPFAIIITDGEARNKETYRQEVGKCNFPVIGVYLRSDMARASDSGQLSQLQSGMAPFHRWRVVADDDSLSLTLRQLAGEVIV